MIRTGAASVRQSVYGGVCLRPRSSVPVVGRTRLLAPARSDCYRSISSVPMVDSQVGGARPVNERDEQQARDIGCIQALVRGDRSALAELYDRYGPIMLAVGRKILGGQREAEDLLHDVFLEAWRAAKSFDPERGTVRAWLLMRMRSRAVDRLRAHNRAKVVLDTEAEMPEPATDAPAPDQVADHERVRAAVAALPEDQRPILLMVYFRGMTGAEVAQALDLPVGTVKSRLARAIQRMRSVVRAPTPAGGGTS